jgi:signal transduction histidine kinase
VVTVTVVEEQNQFALYVEDNGQGNILNSLSLSDLIRKHHFGIVGMYEWAKLAHGELSIKQNGGTAIHLTIPLA